MDEKLVFTLREKIDRENISVLGLEKKAGLKKNAVQNILSGQSKKPSADNVLAIAKALGCTIGELLGEDADLKKSLILLREYSNPSLFGQVAHHIGEYFSNQGKNMVIEEMLNLAEEIYTYSMHNNDKKIDRSFANWILNQHEDKG